MLIIEAALGDYQKLYTKIGFTSLNSWEVARNHSKWVPVAIPGVNEYGPTGSRGGRGRGRGGGRSSKRSKTSDSGNATPSTDGLSSNIPDINLNDDNSDQPLDETPPMRTTT